MLRLNMKYLLIIIHAFADFPKFTEVVGNIQPHVEVIGPVLHGVGQVPIAKCSCGLVVCPERAIRPSGAPRATGAPGVRVTEAAASWPEQAWRERSWLTFSQAQKRLEDASLREILRGIAASGLRLIIGYAGVE